MLLFWWKFAITSTRVSVLQPRSKTNTSGICGSGVFTLGEGVGPWGMAEWVWGLPLVLGIKQAIKHCKPNASFEGLPLNSALFGLVVLWDPCNSWCFFFTWKIPQFPAIHLGCPIKPGVYQWNVQFEFMIWQISNPHAHENTNCPLPSRGSQHIPSQSYFWIWFSFPQVEYVSSPEDTLFSHNHGWVENGCTFERSRYTLSFTEPWLWQQGYLRFQLILSQSFSLSISMTNFSNVYYSHEDYYVLRFVFWMTFWCLLILFW